MCPLVINDTHCSRRWELLNKLQCFQQENGPFCTLIWDYFEGKRAVGAGMLGTPAVVHVKACDRELNFGVSFPHLVQCCGVHPGHFPSWQKCRPVRGCFNALLAREEDLRPGTDVI